ncbi:MAG: carbonic anhydrase, partial [Woeseiaceae bacterium]
MMSAVEGLERLRRGNARFVANEQKRDTDNAKRAALAAGQNPFAVVLGCSDSRMPVEIVFDQGLGDLFVIR